MAEPNAYLSGELHAAIQHRIMHGTSYRGVPTLKMPMDAWVYQELIFELRPDFVIEIGNRHGGSLSYLLDLCDLVQWGDVIGVDIDHTEIAGWHPSLVTGDAIAVFPQVAEIVADGSCLVIEDSAHTYDHTLAVLRTYSALVQPGGYLICEDGVMPEVARALRTFLAAAPEFEADRSREWPLTWNPNGYLRRVA